jgi:hypothetical protein
MVKIIYNVILAMPASFVVRYLKLVESPDTYDYSTNFNPFIILKDNP